LDTVALHLKVVSGYTKAETVYWLAIYANGEFYKGTVMSTIYDRKDPENSGL